MKKIIIALFFLVSPALVLASGGECGHIPCKKANIDIQNQASLQRGAKLFVNYCMGCHSAKYMSYERMGQDLGLTKKQVLNNLVFTDGKIGDYMTIAMPAKKSKAWFGTTPPDLTLEARSRGVDWLYTYLLSFYADETRPLGVNNLVFKDVGMPHVLWQLQGLQELKNEEEIVKGKGHTQPKFELIREGSMSPAKYDQAMMDLVNFLAYASEPAKLVRKGVGVWVILFLLVFLVPAYLMKKEYWKDVH